MNRFLISVILLFGLGFSSYAQKNNNIVENNNNFAFRLFKNISEQDTNNVFISPISISTALSMTYDGAKGRTAREMRKTLGFTKDQADSHNEFTELLKFYREGKQDIFTIVNAAFAQEKYDFKDDYFNLLKDYNAVIKQADFIDEAKREEARLEINQWVLENTNDKIEELLDKSSVDRLTRLVLLNAIHFKADWMYKFPKEKTRQMIFHHPTRQYIGTFMHIKHKFMYYEDSSLSMLEIPYSNNDASMFVILPIDTYTIDNFIRSFDYDNFKSIIESSSEKTVDLLLPKFKIENKFKLKPNLKEMGMVTAFTNRANFKGMNGRSDLLIDDVIHQSFIEIDENGTEAAAATAVIVRQKSLPKVTYMNLNRPFVFVIVEKHNNSILFIGKFMNPKK